MDFSGAHHMQILETPRTKTHERGAARKARSEPQSRWIVSGHALVQTCLVGETLPKSRPCFDVGPGTEAFQTQDTSACLLTNMSAHAK